MAADNLYFISKGFIEAMKNPDPVIRAALLAAEARCCGVITGLGGNEMTQDELNEMPERKEALRALDLSEVNRLAIENADKAYEAMNRKINHTLFGESSFGGYVRVSLETARSGAFQYAEVSSEPTERGGDIRIYRTKRYHKHDCTFNFVDDRVEIVRKYKEWVQNDAAIRAFISLIDCYRHRGWEAEAQHLEECQECGYSPGECECLDGPTRIWDGLGNHVDREERVNVHLELCTFYRYQPVNDAVDGLAYLIGVDYAAREPSSNARLTDVSVAAVVDEGEKIIVELPPMADSQDGWAINGVGEVYKLDVDPRLSLEPTPPVKIKNLSPPTLDELRNAFDKAFDAPSPIWDLIKGTMPPAQPIAVTPPTKPEEFPALPESIEMWSCPRHMEEPRYPMTVTHCEVCGFGQPKGE